MLLKGTILHLLGASIQVRWADGSLESIPVRYHSLFKGMEVNDSFVASVETENVGGEQIVSEIFAIEKV